MRLVDLFFLLFKRNFVLQFDNTMTSKTKKVTFWSVIALVLFFAGSLLYFGSRTSQNDLIADRNQGVLGELMIDSLPQYVVLRPGLRFKLDTGADFSSITERDLHFLDSLGFKAVESTYPILGRDGRGDIRLNTKRYTLSLPFYMWDTTVDSLGNLHQEINYNASNILKNVDFAPADTEFSVLGIDFLEKFLVEYRAAEKMMAFYFDVPEDYEFSEVLQPSDSPLFWPFLGHRYYMDAYVDNTKNRYFLDTGISQAFIHRPMSDAPKYDSNVRPDTIISLRGSYPALADQRGWLKIGDREGMTTVYYYDSDEESYGFNPINMFDNINVLFNFPAKKIGFKI